MGGLFRSKGSSPVIKAPDRSADEVAAAEAAERRRAAQARGRSSTILGGALGGELSDQNVNRKSLLGG